MQVIVHDPKPPYGLTRIVIYGNSVGLKMRPPRTGGTERTYGEWLESFGAAVVNISRAGTLVTQAFKTYDEDILCRFPSAVVFNFGVVEASRRRYPRAAWLGSVSHAVFLNQITGRSYPRWRLSRRVRRVGWTVVKFLCERVSKLFGLSWQWVPLPLLLRTQREMLELLFKETASVAILMGINPCSQRIEDSLPGSRSAIREANQALRALSAEFPRCRFLDPSAETGGDESRMHPDGVHYSAEGHLLIANALRRELSALGVHLGSDAR